MNGARRLGPHSRSKTRFASFEARSRPIPANRPVCPPTSFLYQAGGIELSYRAEMLTDRRSHFLEIKVDKAPVGDSFDWVVCVSAFGPHGGLIARSSDFVSVHGNVQVKFE